MTDPSDTTPPREPVDAGTPPASPAGASTPPPIAPPDTMPPPPDATPSPPPIAPPDTMPPPPADTTTPPPVGPAGSATPPLRADPDRPADSGWREPPWIPGRVRARNRGPNTAAIVIGLILIGLGAYWFLDQTLGLAMPRISWSGVWPVILIVIGGLILIRSLERRS